MTCITVTIFKRQGKPTSLIFSTINNSYIRKIIFVSYQRNIFQVK